MQLYSKEAERGRSVPTWEIAKSSFQISLGSYNDFLRRRESKEAKAMRVLSSEEF